MLKNRTMPKSTVIPVLSYHDVGQAVDWLCAAFGFTIRWRAGNHRAQLNVGDGAIAVTQGAPSSAGHTIMVRVENAEKHRERAVKHGARILNPPTDYPYGERQYDVEDIGGHVWTFSETIADILPEDWGGLSDQL